MRNILYYSISNYQKPTNQNQFVTDHNNKYCQINTSNNPGIRKMVGWKEIDNQRYMQSKMRNILYTNTNYQKPTNQNRIVTDHKFTTINSVNNPGIQNMVIGTEIRNCTWKPRWVTCQNPHQAPQNLTNQAEFINNEKTFNRMGGLAMLNTTFSIKNETALSPNLSR